MLVTEDGIFSIFFKKLFEGGDGRVEEDGESVVVYTITSPAEVG
jgi:hypothetical protein